MAHYRAVVLGLRLVGYLFCCLADRIYLSIKGLAKMARPHELFNGLSKGKVRFIGCWLGDPKSTEVESSKLRLRN